MAEQHGLQPGQDDHPADDNSSHLRTGKRGRKPDDIREFFTVVEGTYVSTSKRSAHRCNGCGEVIPATTSTQHNLKDHVLNRCSQPEPAAQLLALSHEPAAGASSGPDAAPGPAPAPSKKRRAPSGQLPYAAPAVLSPQQQQAVSENLLRFLVTSGTPLEAVGNPYLGAALQGLSSSYALPTPPALSTSILVQEYASCCLHLYQLLQSAAVTSLTVSAAVWEDAQGRQVLVVLVLLPDGTCRLMEAQQLSRDMCSSSSSMAGFIRDVLMRYNIVEKVLLLVAGEGPGLHQATQLVVTSDGFKHILATRCLRTAVSSIVDAAVSHPWAQQLLVAAQRLVLSLGAWPGPGAMGAAGGLAGTMRPISSSCPLSVMECLDSLLVHQQALQQLQQQQQHQQLHQQLHQPQQQQQEEEEGTGLALPPLDEQVWLGWQLLADVLRPLCRALAGIAAAQANLADATRCLLHLVAGVAAALPHVPDDYQAAVGAAVSQQLQQVDAPLCRLALFLDPRFRLAALNRSSSSSSAEAPNGGSSRGHPAGGGGWQHEGDMLTTVQDTAALYAHSRGYTPADITQLLDQLSAYSSGEDPYQLPWPTLQLDSSGGSNSTGSSAACRSWWRDVRAAGSQGSHLLADLAMQLLSGTPHCALHPWARTSTSSSSSLSSGWALAGEQRAPGNPSGVTGAMVAAVKLCHQGHALAHQHNQHQAHLAVQALGGSSSSMPSLEALQEMGLPPELASSIQSLAAAVRSEAGGLPLGLSMQSSSAAPVAAAAGTGAGFSGAIGAPAAAPTSNGVGGGVAGSSLLVPGGLSNAAGLALTHAAAAAAFMGAQAAPFMAVAPVAWAAAAEAAAGSLLVQQQGHISLAAALAAAAAPAAEGEGMAVHHRASADGTAALTAAELAGLLAVLFEQHRERQQQQGHGAVSCLPADDSSWSQAVGGAFGQWDLSADLLGPGYREVLQPSQRTILAPADCDPLDVVRNWRQRKQQQQQQQKHQQ